MDTALIFASGAALPDVLRDDLPHADIVVAADGGYDIAAQLGMSVDVVIGDFDSLQAPALPRHVAVERHQADKDATDLELALSLVLRDDPSRIVVVGGSGGRLDHELGVATLICANRWSAVDEIDWVSDRGWAYVVRRRRILHGDIGQTVSLLPIGGDALGVHTQGLRWELTDATLAHGSSLGLSNVMTSPVADIRVGYGCLLVVVPSQPPSPAETEGSRAS